MRWLSEDVAIQWPVVDYAQSNVLGCDLGAGQLIVVIETRINTNVFEIFTCMYFRLSYITAWW